MELNKVIHKFVQKCTKDKINFDTIRIKYISRIDEIDKIIKTIYPPVKRVLPIECMNNGFDITNKNLKCQAEKYEFGKCKNLASFVHNNTYLCWKHSYFLAQHF